MMDQTNHLSEHQRLRDESSLTVIKQDVSRKTTTLRGCVESTMQNYFDQLDGEPASDVYDMVMREVEAPLFKMVMRYVRDNQTKASQLLGINRGTLRKKLKQYDLL